MGIVLALGTPRGAYMPLLFGRVIHLGRLTRLPSYISDINHYLHIAGIRVSSDVDLLARSFLYYGLVNHWNGCVWFAIHRYLERNVEDTWAIVDRMATFDDAAG